MSEGMLGQLFSGIDSRKREVKDWVKTWATNPAEAWERQKEASRNFKHPTEAELIENLIPGAGLGTIVKASPELAKQYAALRAKGVSESEIWKTIKAWQLPSLRGDGQIVTERTVDVQSIDPQALAKTDPLNTLPLRRVASIKDDLAPQDKANLDAIEVTRLAPSTRSGLLGQLETADSGKQTLGIAPNKPGMRNTVTHEIGHALRTKQGMPTAAGVENLVQIAKEAATQQTAIKAILEASPEELAKMKQWAGLASKAGSQNARLFNYYMDMSPDELKKAASTMDRLVKRMDRYDSKGEQYLHHQDEVMSRLDEVRSPWSDAEQRAMPPWKTARWDINYPVDMTYLDNTSYNDVLTQLNRAYEPRRARKIQDLNADPFRSGLEPEDF